MKVKQKQSMAMEWECSRVDVRMRALAMRSALFVLLAMGAMAASAVPRPPLPLMPLPSYRQLKFQRQEQTMFFHFGVNTFAGNEHGDGTDDPSIFNPEGLVLSFTLTPWLYMSNGLAVWLHLRVCIKCFLCTFFLSGYQTLSR